MMWRTAIINEIRSFPENLHSVIGNLPEPMLENKVVNWSIKEVIHHLADSHLNSYIRIKMTLTEAFPTIKPYDESAWSKLVDYQIPASLSLEMLKSIHARISAVLENMKEDDWKRKLVHPEIGELTLEAYLVRFADHGRGHLDKIRSSLKKS